MLLVDGISRHPKLLAAGAEAAWLWVAAIDYCRDQLTDGFLPEHAVHTLGLFRSQPTKLAFRLVEVGLLEACEGGWKVHDYLDHNDSRNDVKAKKKENAERQRAFRSRQRGMSADASVTHVSQRDESVTSRARVGVGTGTGVGTGVHPEDPRLSEGDLWETWRATAEGAGRTIPLTPSAKDFEHLRVLQRSYTPEQLRAALVCWWASPHVELRYLGTFRADVGDVLAHLAASPGLPFRAPKPSANSPGSRATATLARVIARGAPS